MRYASAGFVQCARANGFEQGARVYELVLVSMGFCAVHVHKSFMQCACATSSCPCSVLVWNQYGSWAGACMNELVCESVCFCARVWERVKRSSCVRTSTSVRYSPQGVCPMCFSARAGACVVELMCASLYIYTVRAHKDFVLLCFCTRVRERVQMNSSARVCTSVRFEPTRVLYNVLGLAQQDFVQRASVLMREHVQISSCTRACKSVRREPMRALCFCAGACTSVRCEPTRALCNVLLSSCLCNVLV